jgi:peptidoglycan/LPS O-acetylase OafA/YrhL
VTALVDATALATEPTLGADRQTHHRRDIQGLRAVAVIVVLLFHGGGFLSGGFIGVDMFFVISGFVITLLLMREWADHGQIRLVRFAVRRFRRLSPPLAVTVVATLLISVVLASPLGQMQMTTATAVGAMLFAANFAVLKTSVGYFHPTTETNALLHTWSLSVEEQFYFIFPLLLLVAFAVSRRWRARWVPVATIVAATLVSLAVTLLPSVGAPLPFHRTTQSAFYSPVTRVWEFGVGALLALAGPAARITKRWLSIVCAGAACAALAWCIVTFSERTQHPGPPTLVPVLATALLIAACADSTSPQARLFGSGPLHWVGDRSYSWYLWHWPVIVFVATAVSPNRWALLTASLASIVLAMASYRWVEQPMRSAAPMRFANTPRLVVLCLGVPTLLAGGLWLGVRDGFGNEKVQSYQDDVLPAHEGSVRRCDSALTQDVWNWSSCVWQPTAGAAPDAPAIYLVGDSHADHVSEAMIAAADELGRPLHIATVTACPMTGLMTSHGEPRIYVEGCRDYNRDVVDYLVAQAPGTVVISNSNVYWSLDEFSAGLDADSLTNDTETKRALYRTSMERLVRTLEDAGHQVLAMQTVPNWATDPTWEPLRCSIGDITGGDCRAEQPRSDTEQQQAIERDLTRAAVEAAGGQVIEPRDALCPDGTCRTEMNGTVVYRDFNHLSRSGSALLAPLFVAAISDPG